MAVTFPTDLEIARQAKLLPMPEIAKRMGIAPELLEPYGHDVAKIKLEAIDELAGRPKAKYVVVSAITPTPLGEGKTTTTVGLGQALTHIGRTATVVGPNSGTLSMPVALGSCLSNWSISRCSCSRFFWV